MITPTFKHERQLWSQGYRYVAGVDEVGRGAWAGPLVAAAVIFPSPRESTVNSHSAAEEKPFGFIRQPEGLGNRRRHDFTLLRDSKLLSPTQREKLAPLIKKASLVWAVAEVSVEFIQTRGLTAATEMAMLTALKKLGLVPDFHLIDYFTLKALPPEKQRGLKHGDTFVASIAAASVIAKVHRDALMVKLHHKFPRYGWAANKGYGTKFHQKALARHGPCPLHRLNFLPSLTSLPPSLRTRPSVAARATADKRLPQPTKNSPVAKPVSLQQKPRPLLPAGTVGVKGKPGCSSFARVNVDDSPDGHTPYLHLASFNRQNIG